MSINFGVFTWQNNGLIYPDTAPPTFEQITHTYKLAQHLHDISSWVLGDTICYAQKYYTDIYEQLLPVTKRSRQTLYNIASTCRHFAPHERRIDDLDFGHHEKVQALPQPERETWLNRAIENDWTVAELNARVQFVRDVQRGKLPSFKFSASGQLLTNGLLLDMLSLDAVMLEQLRGLNVVGYQVTIKPILQDVQAVSVA